MNGMNRGLISLYTVNNFNLECYLFLPLFLSASNLAPTWP